MSNRDVFKISRAVGVNPHTVTMIESAGQSGALGQVTVHLWTFEATNIVKALVAQTAAQGSLAVLGEGKTPIRLSYWPEYLRVRWNEETGMWMRQTKFTTHGEWEDDGRFNFGPKHFRETNWVRAPDGGEGG